VSLTYRAVPLVSGKAEGPSFVLREPLSFWGGLDATSGTIIDRWHQQNGEVLSGRVLVMEAGRGSSSGSSVLAEAIRLGTGPLGIVLLARDAIVTVGAMVAAELYGSLCPVLLASREDWQAITESPHLRLVAEGDCGTIAIR
jgi:hypothetical protein